MIIGFTKIVFSGIIYKYQKFSIIAVIFILNITFINSYSQNQFFGGTGTIYGGAINNVPVENSSGKALFGLTAEFGYLHLINEKIAIKPSLSYEYRHYRYSANESKDTVVKAEIGGNLSEIPTYYKSEVNGKANSRGITINLNGEYRFIERSALIFGGYNSFFVTRNDYVDLNVRIGEGGFLPDIDSSYNNGHNMRPYEIGVTLGGKYYILENLSFSITGTRALTSLYSDEQIKNEKGENVLFYSTYAKITVNYYFRYKR